MDIFTYVRDIYIDLVRQRWNLEQETIKNSLTLAILTPDEFSYNIMKGPGYMAVVTGEVIHIIQCVPVDVTVAHLNECYAELPVKRNNKTWFMKAKTHILLQKGTQISCSNALPAQYKIHNKWYKIVPKPVETINPIVINPIINNTLKFEETGNLATSGLYSMKELEDLRNYINFPMEKPAILNQIARKVEGKPTVHQGGSFSRLLDDDALELISSNFWNKIWKKFMTFGSISAGIMMIIMIFNLLKLVIDTMIRGYTLYTIYGWSARIFGAFFASITALLIHLGANTTNNEPAPRSDVELNQIPYTPLPTNPSSKPISSTYPLLHDPSALGCVSENIRQGSQFP